MSAMECQGVPRKGEGVPRKRKIGSERMIKLPSIIPSPLEGRPPLGPYLSTVKCPKKTGPRPRFGGIRLQFFLFSHGSFISDVRPRSRLDPTVFFIQT